MRSIPLFLLAMSLMAETDLDRSKWELVQEGAVPGRARPMLLFEKGDYVLRVCNTMRGKATVEAGKLKAGGGPSTLMACPGELGDLETALRNAIVKNSAFAINGDRLTLSGEGGPVYEFRRVPMPPADAATKFIYVASTKKECTGVTKMECLQIRDTKDVAWRLSSIPIVGFDHVPGIEYRLRLKEEKIAHPPADAANVRWYLDAVIEQTVVDRTAADAYQTQRLKR